MGGLGRRDRTHGKRLDQWRGMFGGPGQAHAARAPGQVDAGRLADRRGLVERDNLERLLTGHMA